MDSVKKIKLAYIIYSAAMILIGFLFLIWPEISAVTMCFIIGSAAVVFGIVKIISYFANDVYGLAFQFDFALGIFSALIGLFLILHPQGSISFVNVIIGLLVLIDGIFKVQTAIDAYSFGLEHWWMILLLAILTGCISLLLIFNPFEGAVAFALVVGISLIIDGIENLYVAACTVKLIKREKPISDK